VAADFVARAVALLAAQKGEVPGNLVSLQILEVNGARVAVGCERGASAVCEC